MLSVSALEESELDDKLEDEGWLVPDHARALGSSTEERAQVRAKFSNGAADVVPTSLPSSSAACHIPSRPRS